MLLGSREKVKYGSISQRVWGGQELPGGLAGEVVDDGGVRVWSLSTFQSVCDLARVTGGYRKLWGSRSRALGAVGLAVVAGI